MVLALPAVLKPPALPPAVWPEAHKGSEPPSQYLENETGPVTPTTSPPRSETRFPSGALTDPEVLLSVALAGLGRQALPQLAHALLQALLAQNGCPVVARLDDADFHPEVAELTPGEEEPGLSLGPDDDQGSSGRVTSDTSRGAHLPGSPGAWGCDPHPGPRPSAAFWQISPFPSLPLGSSR